MQMKESNSFKDMAKNEQDRREQTLTTLESLSGFNGLSKKQKQYINLSLYVQQRAERGTDPGSAAHIHVPQGSFLEKIAPGRVLISDPNKHSKDSGSSERGGYFLSQAYIAAEYCHRAVRNLEEYREGGQADPEWHELGAPSYAELEQSANAFNGHPCVVEVWDGQPGGKTSIPLHTSLILGRNQNNELMVWEKAGSSSPFQLLPLQQVYNAYAGDIRKSRWRIRSLAV